MGLVRQRGSEERALLRCRIVRTIARKHRSIKEGTSSIRGGQDEGDEDAKRASRTGHRRIQFLHQAPKTRLMMRKSGTR